MAKPVQRAPMELFWALGATDVVTVIALAECLAAVVVYYSLARSRVLTNKRVIHFIDNTSALSALVNGYATKVAMARMVNAFWVAQLALNNNVWLEWVPSAANPADLPSRAAWAEYFEVFGDSMWADTVFPPMDNWTAPFEVFAGELAAFLRTE